MSKLTGLTLLISGLGIAAYAIPLSGPSGSFWGSSPLPDSVPSHISPSSSANLAKVERPALALSANTTAIATGTSQAVPAPTGLDRLFARTRPDNSQTLARLNTTQPKQQEHKQGQQQGQGQKSASRSFSAGHPLTLDGHPLTLDHKEATIVTASATKAPNTSGTEQNKKSAWWRFAVSSTPIPAQKVEVAVASAVVRAVVRKTLPTGATRLPLIAAAAPPLKSQPELPAPRMSGTTLQQTLTNTTPGEQPPLPLEPVRIARVTASGTPAHNVDLAQTKPENTKARFILARNLQQELSRVGCYHGDIDGKWGNASRVAMRKFTSKLNATLPVSEPDYILLTLVQGHYTRACGRPCTTGQSLSTSGTCERHETILARQNSKSPVGRFAPQGKSATGRLAPRPTLRRLNSRKIITRNTTAPIVRWKPAARATKRAGYGVQQIVQLPTRRQTRRQAQARRLVRATQNRRLAQNRSTAIVSAAKPISLPTRRATRLAVTSRPTRSKIPLPGRMTIGAASRQNQHVNRPNLDTSQTVNLRDTRLSTSSSVVHIQPIRTPTRAAHSFSQTQRNNQAVSSLTNSRPISKADAELIRDAARRADNQSRSVVPDRTEAAIRQRRQARVRRATIARLKHKNRSPKYFVGAAQRRAAPRAAPRVRARSRKRKTWKKNFYSRLQEGGK